MATAVLHPRPAGHQNHLQPGRNKSFDSHSHHRLSLFSSSNSATEAAEQEYDRLRTLSQSEYDQRQDCFERSASAYRRGDHAAAHELSERAKEHGRQADRYARQASEFMYGELNKPGLVDEDTIDLHGQYVGEAEEIVERKLQEARRKGRKGLTVIVGRGNHSTDQQSKLKPCIENICRKHRLRCYTEAHNQGRIFIDLVGGSSGDSNNNTITQHDNYHHEQQHVYTEKHDHASAPERKKKIIADWKRLNCFRCVVM